MPLHGSGRLVHVVDASWAVVEASCQGVEVARGWSCQRVACLCPSCRLSRGDGAFPMLLQIRPLRPNLLFDACVFPSRFGKKGPFEQICFSLALFKLKTPALFLQLLLLLLLLLLLQLLLLPLTVLVQLLLLLLQLLLLQLLFLLHQLQLLPLLGHVELVLQLHPFRIFMLLAQLLLLLLQLLL